MQKVILGKSNIEVSRLCFGTLTIGPIQANFTLDYGSELISYAISKGINFFDTAQLYQTYNYLKLGMKKANKNDIIISSKTYAYSKQMAIDAVEQARVELDRDYIDIFMLHEQQSEHTFNGHKEALEYLLECKQKGIIKAVGASMHHISAVVAAANLGLDVIHPIFNIDGLGIADGTIEQMQNVVKNAFDNGIGVFAMKALGGGNLFSKAEQCLDFVLSKQYIHSVAIGMQSEAEIDCNSKFFETGILDENSKLELSKKNRQLLVEEWCTACGACVNRCNNKALSIVDNRAVVDKNKCVLCGYCSRVCPDFLIKII